MKQEDYYSGFCVGGPKDGQFEVASNPYFDVVKEPKFNPVSFEAEIPLEALTFQRYRYEHMIGLRGTYEIDFWVNRREFAEVADVFRHVFREYGRMKRNEIRTQDT